MGDCSEVVRNLTLQLRFTWGTALLFQGVNWYWFTTGITPAVRKAVASFQEDWRGGSRSLEALMDDITQCRTRSPLHCHSSHSLQRSSTADGDCLDGGCRVHHQAAVIARNETGAEDILTPDETQVKWSVVQSNYDRQGPTGASIPDSSTDPRRTAAALAHVAS